MGIEAHIEDAAGDIRIGGNANVGVSLVGGLQNKWSTQEMDWNTSRNRELPSQASRVTLKTRGVCHPNLQTLGINVEELSYLLLRAHRDCNVTLMAILARVDECSPVHSRQLQQC